MVTSFISRWSKRKLDEKTHELIKTDNQPVTDDQPIALSDEEVTEQSASIKAEETSTDSDSQTVDNGEAPEEMSIANLLTSEVEQSVKKAALRKLFLSEEFNIRDGLDDYDDDYSNLKSLSQSVAETLRGWVKEQPEEELETEPVALVNETERDEDSEGLEQPEIQEQDSNQESNQLNQSELLDSPSDDNNHTDDETKYTTP
ncbi:DUF3306 domain-containing protein [Vibrio kasasachensis]|uniref:DUF3306 domain-containing protein n=1 Tax=Vibrio kasasachensis TaxID=2910248 RepID=UPI003D1125B4